MTLATDYIKIVRRELAILLASAFNKWGKIQSEPGASHALIIFRSFVYTTHSEGKILSLVTLKYLLELWRSDAIDDSSETITLPSTVGQTVSFKLRFDFNWL